MRKEKGVTLISLIMYIILMTFVLAIVIRLTFALYSNLNEIDGESESTVDISKFNMYFLNDIKNKHITVSEIDSMHIKLHDNDNLEDITYSVSNKVLYRNKVKICDNVKDIDIVNDNNIIQIYLRIDNYSKETTYVIE